VLAAADPLAAAFEPPGGPIGLLAIEPGTRSRIRLNGTAVRTPDGILVDVTEVFGNCRKYIQRRAPGHGLDPPRKPQRRTGTGLDEYQAALIRRADTFFIASSHPQRGADASHRGGSPGFVEVCGEPGTLRFPDYPGNRMFQTLGNITVDPRVGLLFADWDTGSVLQLTGRARIVWDKDHVATWPAAERLVEVQIDAIREQERVIPTRWDMLEASRVNPGTGSELATGQGDDDHGPGMAAGAARPEPGRPLPDQKPDTRTRALCRASWPQDARRAGRRGGGGKRRRRLAARDRPLPRLLLPAGRRRRKAAATIRASEPATPNSAKLPGGHFR
jgi:predicted pyridoxine 5'-phosphate oxidase superfamily flavin-nucleotide-binding protein